jgi:hypothetical protein
VYFVIQSLSFGGPEMLTIPKESLIFRLSFKSIVPVKEKRETLRSISASFGQGMVQSDKFEGELWITQPPEKLGVSSAGHIRCGSANADDLLQSQYPMPNTEISVRPARRTQGDIPERDLMMGSASPDAPGQTIIGCSLWLHG